MRQDIEIHINTGDITLSSKQRVILRDFKWIERTKGQEQRYLYGEITMPATIIEDTVVNQGIYIEIPYTPIYKEFKIRIKRQYTDEDYSYIRNPQDGSEWFIVQCAMYGNESRKIYASELLAISESTFYIAFDGAVAQLYSGLQSDMNIIKANWQNRNLLLKCVPGNCYRYPLVGVGLIRWTNSNISVSKLAQVIKEQFLEDGTPVIGARYDFNSKQLYLNIDTSNVDKDANI